MCTKTSYVIVPHTYMFAIGDVSHTKYSSNHRRGPIPAICIYDNSLHILAPTKSQDLGYHYKWKDLQYLMAWKRLIKYNEQCNLKHQFFLVKLEKLCLNSFSIFCQLRCAPAADKYYVHNRHKNVHIMHVAHSVHSGHKKLRDACSPRSILIKNNFVIQLQHVN